MFICSIILELEMTYKSKNYTASGEHFIRYLEFLTLLVVQDIESEIKSAKCIIVENLGCLHALIVYY